MTATTEILDMRGRGGAGSRNFWTRGRENPKFPGTPFHFHSAATRPDSDPVCPALPIGRLHPSPFHFHSAATRPDPVRPAIHIGRLYNPHLSPPPSPSAASAPPCSFIGYRTPPPLCCLPSPRHEPRQLYPMSCGTTTKSHCGRGCHNERARCCRR